MEIGFTNNCSKKYNKYRMVFCDFANKTFNILNDTRNYIIEVTLVDNEQIHKINKEYRDVDRPTDVISFAFLDDENERRIVGDAPISLGEILISCEKAEEQAIEYGHSVERELSFLFVHGLLHLLGFDHMKIEDEKIMFALQKQILGDK